MKSEQLFDIPYPEYHAIVELATAHSTQEKDIKAVIAFGDLLTRGNTFDIDLLEIAVGWAGPGIVEFASSAALPLRGTLRLHLISVEEFEHPERIQKADQKRWVVDLLTRVRQGFEAILERPSGYASERLRTETISQMAYPPSSGTATGYDPLNLASVKQVRV